jgi:hypothetical protein
VLDLLVKNKVISKELRSRMLACLYNIVSAHNESSVAAKDVEGRKNLAGYILRVRSPYRR